MTIEAISDDLPPPEHPTLAMPKPRQLSLRRIFAYTSAAALFSAGVVNNWPDIVAVLWLSLLMLLIISTAHQIERLFKNRNGLFDSNDNVTRLTWITCRMTGVMLLGLVILNPMGIENLENIDPYGFYYSASPVESYSDNVFFESSRTMLGLGILMCIVPMWRIRRIGHPSHSRRLASAAGTLCVTIVAIAIMSFAVFNSQIAPVLLFENSLSSHQGEPYQVVENETDPSPIDFRQKSKEFSIRCGWLVGFTMLTILGCFIFVCQYGSTRLKLVFFALWMIGFAGSAFLLGSIYSKNGNGLTQIFFRPEFWADGLAGPILVILVLACGFIVAAIVGRNNTPTNSSRRIGLKKLANFAPRSLPMVALLVLVSLHIYALCAIRIGLTFPGTIFQDVFRPFQPGPIHIAVMQLFSNDFSVVWAALFLAIPVNQLAQNSRKYIPKPKFDAEVRLQSINELCLNGIVASLTLVVVALGFGWFAFASLIRSPETPFATAYFAFNNLLWFNWLMLLPFNIAAAMLLASILSWKFLRRIIFD